MHRVLSLSTCALLSVLAAGCGATHADAHLPAVRHASSAPPPVASSLWVADQYFVSSAFPDEAAHVTGEFARRFAPRPTLGSLLAPSARVALRPLVEHGDSAIIAATVSDRGRVSEWYSYLVRERGAWKMYALRTVEFSPTFHARLDSLDRGLDAPDAPEQHASMALAAGSDSALRAFVASHVAPLDSLVDVYRAAPGAPAMLDVGDSGADSVHHLLVTTGASTVFRNVANPGCTFVRIAGEGRRQVGAFRADTGCRIPSMSPDGLVYTEHVQGPWYVYRAL